MLRKNPTNPDTQKPRREPTKAARRLKEVPHLIVPRQDAPGCPIERFDRRRPSAAVGQPSKLYHRTNRVAARRIMRHGFKDSTNYYMKQRIHTGAWLSSVPLHFKEGAYGEILLQVETDLGENELARYECIEEGRGYREWLVPSALINPHMKVSIVPHG